MSEVTVFERFLDALDRRNDELTKFEGCRDYKAGFMQSLIELMAKDSADARAKLVMATKMLEDWSAEDEQVKRARNAEDEARLTQLRKVL